MLTNVLPVERGSHREARPRSSLLALVLVVGLILVGAEAWAWQTTLSGTGSGAFYAAAVDSAGNVIAAGATAPDFTLPYQEGSRIALSDLRGSWVVLWWFPKASTGG